MSFLHPATEHELANFRELRLVTKGLQKVADATPELLAVILKALESICSDLDEHGEDNLGLHGVGAHSEGDFAAFLDEARQAQGFSLRAATWVMASDRRGLWRLCAYGACGAVSSSRLSELPDGRFAYDMKRALPDDRRRLVMTGVELLEKLVPLMPLTTANQTRFITAR